MLHARVDHACGDATPDPVGDAKLAFHDKVPQVMRQLGPCPRELLHPVDHAVAAFDDRVGARMAGEPPERDAHKPTMRITSARGLTIFRQDRQSRRSRQIFSMPARSARICSAARRLTSVAAGTSAASMQALYQ